MQRRRVSSVRHAQPTGDATMWRLLYLAHVLLELVLGGVKLRGTYSGVVVPEAAAKFARHHGVSLLALTLLGALVLLRGQISTPTGQVTSITLAAFHAGAVLVMIHAEHWPVVCTHAPFALGFAAHALTGSF